MKNRIQQTPAKDITQTIDQILQHHYFNSRLQQIISNKKIHYDSSSVTGLLDDQYYKAEEQVVEDIGNIVNGIVENQLREVLTKEFINIEEEIEGIKREMFVFMDEQAKKVDDVRKQITKVAQQLKRRASTSQAMSNTAVVNSNGYTGGIRFIRNSMSSSVQGSSSSTNPNQPESKSFHSQLMDMKKQIEQLKQSIEQAQSVKFIQQQFNQFKIQTKVALEALKQGSKKMAVDIGSVSKLVNNSNTLSPVIKQNIQVCVKRTITAQLKVYGSYSQQILQIKGQIQKFDEKVQKQSETYHEYLSNQLKSVWLVLNDMKRHLDQVTEHIGMGSITEII